MRFKLSRDISQAHDWFAWYPVVAQRKTGDGIEYVLIWLEKVKRTYVRTNGVNIWQLESYR